VAPLIPATTGHDGGREEGEGVRFPSSPWAGAERGGAPTMAGGGGSKRPGHEGRRAAALWWRHCGLGRRASGGG